MCTARCNNCNIEEGEECTRLFKHINDCDECPFQDDREYCSHSPDGYHPCEFREDFGEKTVEEVQSHISSGIRAYEEHEDRMYEKEQEKKRKDKEAKEKRDRTRWDNYLLNKELTKLKKAIRNKKQFLSRLSAFSSAVAITNHMFSMNDTEISIPEPKAKHPFEIQIEQHNERILEINKEKKEKAKQRRIKNKEGKEK
jgi:hypothetical protein